ncbi:hypothetical protein EMIT0P43_30274 [Pseudomonas jessenii]
MGLAMPVLERFDNSWGGMGLRAVLSGMELACQFKSF